MIVRCRSITPSASQAERLRGYGRDQRERLEPGRDYVVMGLQLEIDSLIWGSGAWLQLPDGDGLIFAPLCLFDVIDGRMPRRWEARDLAAAKPPAIEAFRRVRDALEIEALTSTNPGPSR
jgi:hypothetical protein